MRSCGSTSVALPRHAADVRERRALPGADTWPDAYRYIVVEGPIGAGKTTLARALAQRAAPTLMLEQPDANPFLARFYRDRTRYALPTQLFFLFQRVQQLRELQQPDLFHGAWSPTSCSRRTRCSRA